MSAQDLSELVELYKVQMQTGVGTFRRGPVKTSPPVA